MTSQRQAVIDSGNLGPTVQDQPRRVVRAEQLGDLEDSVREIIAENIQATVDTTDATQTTLALIPIAANETRGLSIMVRARRTGGSSGAAGDSAFYPLTTVAKNISGTVSLLSQVAGSSLVDQDAWACTIDVSGTSVRIRVTGVANNNITWVASWSEI